MTTRFRLSIQTILLAGFCGLSAVGTGLALVLGLSIAVKNTSELWTESIEASVDQMATEVETRLRTIEQRARYAAARVQDGSVGVLQPVPETTELFFRTLLETTPGVLEIALITTEGWYQGWTRGHAETVREDWSQNTEVLKGHGAPDGDRKTGWGPPLWIAHLDAAAIAYETPLYGPQGYIGYLRYALSLSDISRSLTRIDENAFILFGRDEVLAHAMMIDRRPIDEATVPSAVSIDRARSALIALTELGDPILEQIWNTEDLDFGVGDEIKGEGFGGGSISIGDGEFAFVHRTLDDLGTKPLTIGAYFDAQEADTVFDRMGAAAVAGTVVIIVAVGLGLFVARAIGRPIRALATASSVVEAGTFDQVPQLPRSRVWELDKAVSSFEDMVHGLEEREIIRRTLGRYVPSSIAEQLIKDDGSLEAIEANATILFSDIVGFTTLTEQLGAVRIVEVLNAYFSRMTQIIEAEGGVIAQFHGDAILAIFNVPIEAPDHAERACRAAVKMRKSALSETFADQPISSRIGINTGSVIAGAVGAEGRLSYTVYGDAVNRAARVEVLNKDTKTTILITEATALNVRSLALKLVGKLNVRGQSEPVTVYTTDD